MMDLLKPFSLVLLINCGPAQGIRNAEGDFHVEILVPEDNYKVKINKVLKNVSETKQIVLECNNTLHECLERYDESEYLSEAYEDCGEDISFSEFLENCDSDIGYYRDDDEICDCFSLFLSEGEYIFGLYNSENELINSKKILIDRNVIIDLS